MHCLADGQGPSLGSIDAAQSKLTVDLKTLTSDQQMRDGYIQGRTLETGKFPTMEFVPRRAIGLPAPLPAGMQAQAGFQLVGDTTLHGVTKETTWNVVATFGNDLVGGRATTTFDFATFNLAKPSLAVTKGQAPRHGRSRPSWRGPRIVQVDRPCRSHPDR